jgi:hypothetical protein
MRQMEGIKESIENKIKNYYGQKKELDEIRAVFVRPKKDYFWALLFVLVVLFLLLCVPLSAYIILKITSEMTIQKNYYIDRTKTEQIVKQPIIENKPVTLINNTNYIEKTIYLQPENTANCVKVREVKPDGSYTGKYSLVCQEIKT